MNIVLQIIAGAAFIVFAWLGWAWTRHVYVRGTRSVHSEEWLYFKLVLPVRIFAVLLACYLVYGLATLLVPELPEHMSFDWQVLFALLGLGAVVSLKNLVAPLMLCMTLSWSVFMGLVFGVWAWAPFLAFFADALLFWAPDWAQAGFLWGTVALLAFTTLATDG